MTAMEVLLLIDSPDKVTYYDVFDKCITGRPSNEREVQRFLANKKRKDVKVDDLVPNIMFPTYKEIDHESIMRFFVRECVEDKETRQILFRILSRREYVVPFINKIKELGLYEEFDDCCGSIYNQIIEEWAEKHNIELQRGNG